LTNKTAHQSGFHSANMTIENNREGTLTGNMDSIAQLKMATTSDRGTVMMPTVNDSKLASHPEASQACIKKLKDETADLKANY
jgi:hypothetical protein